MALNRELLDKATCDTPGCECGAHVGDIIYIQCVEHPGEGVAISYDPESGLLKIECPLCDLLLTEVEVAEGHDVLSISSNPR